jgi:hypothetical protein
MVHKTICG